MSQSVISSEKSGEAVQLPQALALHLVLERCIGPLATHNALLAFPPPYNQVRLSFREILSSLKQIDHRVIPHLAALLLQQRLIQSEASAAFWLGIVGAQAAWDRPLTPYGFLTTCFIITYRYAYASARPEPLYAPILVDLARRVEVFHDPQQLEHFAFVEAPLYYSLSPRVQALVVMWSALALANLLPIERALLEIAKLPFYATSPFLPVVHVLLENGNSDARRLFDLWQAAHDSSAYFEPGAFSNHKTLLSILETFDSSEVASTARASLALLPIYEFSFDDRLFLSWVHRLDYKDVSSLPELILCLANSSFGIQVMQRLATSDKGPWKFFKIIHDRVRDQARKNVACLESEAEALRILAESVLQSRPVVFESRKMLEEYSDDFIIQDVCRVLLPDLAQRLDAHFRNAANYFENLQSLARTAWDIITQSNHRQLSLAEASCLAEHAYAELQNMRSLDMERAQSPQSLSS